VDSEPARAGLQGFDLTLMRRDASRSMSGNQCILGLCVLYCMNRRVCPDEEYWARYSSHHHVENRVLCMREEIGATAYAATSAPFTCAPSMSRQRALNDPRRS
jgi:hypothetical protein